MGVSLIAGEQISLVMVAAVFLSNIPEGLSSAAGMRRVNCATGSGRAGFMSSIRPIS